MNSISGSLYSVRPCLFAIFGACARLETTRQPSHANKEEVHQDRKEVLQYAYDRNCPRNFVILTGPCASLYSIAQPALGGISDVRHTFTVFFDCPGDLGKLREVSYDQTLEWVSANAPELLPQFHDAFDRNYDYSNVSSGYPHIQED